MKIKTAFASVALCLVPALGFATCPYDEHQAQSCAPGTVWDSAQKTCVEQVNS